MLQREPQGDAADVGFEKMSVNLLNNFMDSIRDIRQLLVYIVNKEVVQMRHIVKSNVSFVSDSMFTSDRYKVRQPKASKGAVDTNEGRIKDEEANKESRKARFFFGCLITRTARVARFDSGGCGL